MAVALCKLALGLRVSEASLRAAVARNFGPRGCAEVHRTARGTCEIITTCSDADDLSGVEFSFVCKNGTKAQRHSYGRGSFAAEEVFDSGIRCDECLEFSPPPGASPGPPPPAPEPAPPPRPDRAAPGAAENTTAATVTLGSGKPYRGRYPQEVALAGPEHCVRTFRSPGGTCVLETRCKGVDTRGYVFGFTCVGPEGKSKRHMYDQGHVGLKESIDTEVECEACLGLDTRPAVEAPRPAEPGLQPDPLQEEVAGLVESVSDLKQELHWLASNVTRINAAVASQSSAQEPPSPQSLVGRAARRAHRRAGHRGRHAPAGAGRAARHRRHTERGLALGDQHRLLLHRLRRRHHRDHERYRPRYQGRVRDEGWDDVGAASS